MDKSLKDKAIDIKGKKYVLVADRVLYFNDNYENGAIETYYTLDNNTYHFKSVVIPNIDKPTRRFVGHSQAVVGDGMVNKAAAMENAETSAVGRALAMMGIGVLDSIASADEIHKAKTNTTMRFATDKQIQWMRDIARKINDQLGSNDETDSWIESILTVPPRRVPIFKVENAVNKIKEVDAVPTFDDVTVEDIPDGPINLDDLPG